MAGQNEDFAQFHLGSPLAGGERRAHRDDRETPSSRRRWLEEETARAAETARARAAAAEIERAEEAAIRERVLERMERERAEHELRVRLEAQQRAQAAAHEADLAQRERLARVALGDGRRRCSPGAATVAVALTFVVLAAVGAAAHAEVQHQIALASAPRTDSTPVDVHQIALEAARDALARSASPSAAAAAPSATAPAIPRVVHPGPRDRVPAPAARNDNLGSMLEGPDPVAAAGRVDELDSAGRTPRRR